MKINIEDIKKLCNTEKHERIYVEGMLIEKDAIQKIASIMQQQYGQYKNVVMLCDSNTYRIAGKQVEALLPTIHSIVLQADNLHADEHGVDAANEMLKAYPRVDFMIACGSGTIHDITRYHAYHRNLPFLSIPTAASVDGFVSTMAAMTWHGMKKTFTAVSPVFVLADSTIFSQAPARLTASGVGDLIGKYTCLCDWRIAAALMDEYIHWPIVNWEYEILHNLVQNLDGLQKNEISAYENLMYGLLLSGLAMQIVGYSRPASCCEHHCSHLWEEAVINKPINYYHGEKVGVGMILCATAYKKALDFLESGQYNVCDHVAVEYDLIEKYFTNPVLQEEIRKENTPNIMESLTGEDLKQKEKEIIEILKDLPSPEAMISWLKKVNGVTTLPEIGLPETIKTCTLRMSPYVRQRLSFMRIMKYYDFYENVIR